jgi:hypothetical protein
MKDIKVTKCIVNERRELSVNLLIKEWDYTEIEAELLRQCKLSGDTIDILISGLVKADNEDEIKKARQVLWLTMQDYCKAFHYQEKDIAEALYRKYKIKSRTELTLEQVQNEIENYKISIRTWQS